MKTPLLEFVEHKKAEKLRSKEEKREERRRKEFERKKAREEEKRKKKEVKEQHRDMKRKEEHREDTSVKVRIVQYSASHCNWSAMPMHTSTVLCPLAPNNSFTLNLAFDIYLILSFRCCGQKE